MVVGPQVGGIVPLASGFGLGDGLLVFFWQVLDEPVLFACPQAAGGVAGRKDERLDALRLMVYHVGNGLHGTPRLTEYVYGVKM